MPSRSAVWAPCSRADQVASVCGSTPRSRRRLTAPSDRPPTQVWDRAGRPPRGAQRPRSGRTAARRPRSGRTSGRTSTTSSHSRAGDAPGDPGRQARGGKHRPRRWLRRRAEAPTPAVRPHLPGRGSAHRRARRGIVADAGWLAHPRRPGAGARPPRRRRRDDRAPAPDALRRPPPGPPDLAGRGVAERDVDARGAGVRGGRPPGARRLDLGAAAGEGALLAIGESGAYGLAMASGYNGRLRPAQAVIEGGQLRLCRRRETLEDVVARDV